MNTFRMFVDTSAFYALEDVSDDNYGNTFILVYHIS